MPEAGESLQDKVVGGKFRLGRYLGGTERSAVFLTERQDSSAKAAAIKLIPADPAGGELQLARWKSISHLSHPHLLQIFESGRCEQDGEELLYVVMEAAEENLAQTLANRPLAPHEMDELLKPLLQALDYLHNRGFVHSGLKPANIMVAGNQLKLSVDGICRIGERSDTEAGMYAPPEPAGTAMAPPRDVWSIGVIVVQALTQLLPAREGGEAKALTLPETLPARFAELAQNCLERDPQRRCTLAEIAEHLHCELPAAAAAPSVAPSPVPAPSPAPAPARAAAPRRTPDRPRAKAAEPNRFFWPAVAFVLTLVAATGGWRLLDRPAAPPAPPAASQSQQGNSSEPVTLARTEQPPPPISQDTVHPAPLKKQPPARATLKTASEARNPAPPPTPAVGVAASSPGASAVGEVVQQVLPEVSRGAMNTIHGTVRVTVKVRVDPAGRVSAVNFVSAGPSRYFAQKAYSAAQQWKFSPAHRDGQAVASAWNLRFEFIRGATHVYPALVP